MSFSRSSSYLSISSATAMRTPAENFGGKPALAQQAAQPGRELPWLYLGRRGIGCGVDRGGKPDNLTEGQGIQRHTSPANTRIPHPLDGFGAEKDAEEDGNLQRNAMPPEPGG